MIGILRIAAAVGLIVGAGVVQGIWTNRWGTSAAQIALKAQIESVPLTIGEWTGTPFELPAEDRAAAGATGCFGATYTNAARGVTVSVLLLSGLPGKISTHTPDVCYRGTGFTLGEYSEFAYAYGPDNRPAEFRTFVATRTGTSPSALRIFWSWNDSKGWTAPENARWKFASDPALCKLYVVRETWGQVVEPQNDPCKDFLAVFLPELDRRGFAVR
jgi:Protein of unknown function (DUF3485)